jgi:outer membrane protein assembly factor BamB
MRLALVSLGLLLVAPACGDRTSLLLTSSMTPAPEAGTSSPDAAPTGDPCPGAVLARAGRPTFRNCSTHDARSRVIGPMAPSIKWQVSASSFPEGVLLSAGATGDVYIDAPLGSSGEGAVVTRYDAATGNIVWTSNLASGLDAFPTLIANGEVEALVVDSASASLTSLDALDDGTGAVLSSIAFPSMFNPVVPSIGTDGSFFVLGNLVAPGGESSGFALARVAPSGAVVWTSGDLTPSSFQQGSYSASNPAVDATGTIYVRFDSLEASGALLAIDGATGATEWSFSLPEVSPGLDEFKGPVAAPNGSVVVVAPSSAGQTPGQDVEFVSPAGSLVAMATLPGVTDVAILVVTTGSVCIVRTQDAAGHGAIVAVNPDGTTAWTFDSGPVVDATIDAAGSLVAYATDALFALDATTGQLLWKLAAPSSSAMLVDAVVTSNGGIVALDSEGTLFGAFD